MIILYNPWSTPSRKKPLVMSLLAVAAMLEGEFEYEIVDGNLLDDPVGRILEIGREHKLSAVAFPPLPGAQPHPTPPQAQRITTAPPPPAHAFRRVFLPPPPHPGPPLKPFP